MRSMLEDGGVLRPNARTLWEIQEKALHPPAETGGNLYAEIRARAAECLRRGDARRAAVKDAKTLAAYQAEVRRLFLQCIGDLPEKHAAPSVRVMGREEHGFFSAEKILLEPARGSFATAAVYTPAEKREPCPAVLLLIGHTDLGKADPEYQYVAQLLAFSGFVVLALDPPGEGERFEHDEPTLGLQPIQGCSGEHDLLDWKCKLLGVSLARYFIRDGIAALDYLASRPDVDAARVGLTGHSGGGTQVCMMMLAAGDRLACAAPCTFVTDQQAMLEGGVDPDNEMIWPGSLAEGIDYVDLLAGIAPKPLMILAAENDFFPLEGTRRTFREACALWQAAGGSAPEMTVAPHAHAYSPALAKAAVLFFRRCLSPGESDPDRFVFTPLPARALSCTPEGSLLRAFPGMRTLQDEITDLLRNGKREKSSSEAWLASAVNADAACPGSPRVYGEGICGHYAWRAVIWRVGEGHWNNGVFLRHIRAGEGRLPTVIALWPEGLAHLAEHSAWIHRACDQGWQVLVTDVASEGSLLPAPLGSCPMYIGWGTMYKLSAYLIQLGDSLCALRTRDLLATAEMVRQWPETEESRICFFALGEISRCAEFASLLRGIPCRMDPLCLPYEEIAREKYHDQTHTHAWILPGILAHTDSASIRACLTRRGLVAEDMAFTPAETFRHGSENKGGEIK